ncbi:Protein ZBED8 [Thelohanellus kitauei]|uniref:Protein ZBED8 n=1 Tax=Thelohanellus kitauei TaxID=669202 RepID=A0A0C2MR50_THEKT|nr:Protein ZBED8 [Thelohanellus kitauei]
MAEYCQYYDRWFSLFDRKESWSTEETEWPCYRGRLQQGIDILHCILHHMLDVKRVMDPTVKIINFIMERGLNHREFIILHEECGSDSSDVLSHNAERWLNLGKILTCF